MHTDKLGRPIKEGDTVVYATGISNRIRITTVTDLCIAQDGVKCVRLVKTGGLTTAVRVLVINREIEYTKEYYPELLL